MPGSDDVVPPVPVGPGAFVSSPGASSGTPGGVRGTPGAG